MREEPEDALRGGMAEGEVHVWRILLDEEFPSGSGLEECLSLEERERAALIGSTVEKRRFTLSRIALRHVLAAVLGVRPGALRLRREEGGRPFLEDAHDLSFSLTHSHGLALVAVAAQPVGVDAERLRAVQWSERIARRVMHDDTVRALRGLPEPLRRTAFIDAWTQREAHVKALGGGIFRTADDLPFRAEQPADATVEFAKARSTGALWSVARLVPVSGWRATIAAPGTVHRVRQHVWTACE